MSLTPTAATPLAELIELGKGVVDDLRTYDRYNVKKLPDIIEQLVERCQSLDEAAADYLRGSARNAEVADTLQDERDMLVESVKVCREGLVDVVNILGGVLEEVS